MPRHDFSKMREVLPRFRRQLEEDREHLTQEQTAALNEMAAKMDILMDAQADPEHQQTAWNELMDLCYVNGAPIGDTYDHEQTVRETDQLQNDDTIREWRFKNRVSSFMRSLSTLTAREELSPITDRFTAYNNAIREYNHAKNLAVNEIYTKFGSVEAMEKAIQESRKNVEFYRTRVQEIDAQLEYRTDERQALEVGIALSNNDYKKAKQAADDARDAYHAQEKAVADLDKQVWDLQEAERIKQENLRARAAALKEKQDRLNEQATLMANEKAGGQASYLAKAAVELTAESIKATEDLQELRKTPILNTKQAKAVKDYDDLWEEKKDLHDTYSHIISFLRELAKDETLLRKVEERGELYYSKSPAERKLLSSVKTVDNVLAMRYVSLREELMARARTLDARVNGKKAETIQKSVKKDCHSMRDMNSFASSMLERYDSELGKAEQAVFAADKGLQAQLKTARKNSPKGVEIDEDAIIRESASNKLLLHYQEAHLKDQLLRESMPYANDLGAQAQEAMVQMGLEILKEEEAIAAETARLVSDANVKQKADLIARREEAKDKLNKLQKDFTVKTDALDAAGKRLYGFKDQLKIWDTRETYRAQLREAEAAHRENLAVKRLMDDVKEKYDDVVVNASILRDAMPAGKVAKNHFQVLGNHISSGMDWFSKTANVGRKDLSEFAKPDYDRDKKNSTEYKAMIQAVRAAKDSCAAGNAGPAEMKAAVDAVRAAAQAYLIAKERQPFHWRPSPQRKIRLNYAKELIKFCDNVKDGIAHTAERAEQLENAYTRQNIRAYPAMTAETVQEKLKTAIAGVPHKINAPAKAAPSTVKVQSKEAPGLGKG